MLNEDHVIAVFQKSREENRPKISLEAFRQRYLPLLADFFTGQRVDMSPWLAICGRPSASVAVLRPDQSVAFVVPPLLCPVEPKTRQDIRLTASELLTQLERKLLVNPAGADAFMRRVSEVLSPTMEKGEQHRQLWQTLFDDFGITIHGLTPKAPDRSALTEDYELEDI